MSKVVSGGLEGVKKRLASAVTEQRVAALSEALHYNEAGLDLLIEALKDRTEQVEYAAYSLLCQSTEPRIKQILREYDPLAYRRGVECFDVNDQMLLVQAPIQQVAQTFSQMRQAQSWERDVYGRETDILGNDFVVFQLRGHPWTLIHYYCTSGHLFKEDAQALSRGLNTYAIYYRVSDTGGFIEYHLYNDQQLVEMLYHSDDNFEEGEGSGRFTLCCPTQFQSQLRHFEAADIKDAWNFTENFFLEQDAYAPVLFLEEVRVGQRVTLQIDTYRPKVSEYRKDSYYPEPFQSDDFERVDYVRALSLT